MFRKCILLPIFTVICLTSFCQQKDTSLQAAIDKYDAHEYTAAIDIIEARLKLKPDDEMAHRWRTINYRALNKLDELISVYSAGTHNHEKFALAYIWYLKKEYLKSREILKSLVGGGHRSLLTLNLYGGIQRELGDLANSRRLINEALKLDPENAMVQNNMAATRDSMVMQNLRKNHGLDAESLGKVLEPLFAGDVVPVTDVQVKKWKNCFTEGSNRYVVLIVDQSAWYMLIVEKDHSDRLHIVEKFTDVGSDGAQLKTSISSKRDLIYLEVSAYNGSHHAQGTVFLMSEEKTGYVGTHSSQIPTAYYFNDLNKDGYPEIIEEASDFYVKSYSEGYANWNFNVYTLRMPDRIIQNIQLQPELSCEFTKKIRDINAKAVYYASMEFWGESIDILKQVPDSCFEQCEALNWNRILITHHYNAFLESYRKRKDFLSAILLGKMSFFDEYINKPIPETKGIISTHIIEKIFKGLLLRKLEKGNDAELDAWIAKCHQLIMGSYGGNVEMELLGQIQVLPEHAALESALLAANLNRVLYLEKELEPGEFSKLFFMKDPASIGSLAAGYQNIEASFGKKYRLNVLHNAVESWYMSDNFQKALLNGSYNQFAYIVANLVMSKDFNTLRSLFEKYVTDSVRNSPLFGPTCKFYQVHEWLFTGRYAEVLANFNELEKLYPASALVKFWVAYEKAGLYEVAEDKYVEYLKMLRDDTTLTYEDTQIIGMESMLGLGRIAYMKNDWPEAKRCLLTAKNLIDEESGDRTRIIGYRTILLWLSKVCLKMNDIQMAEAYAELSLYYCARAVPAEGKWRTSKYRYDYRFLPQYYLQRYQIASATGRKKEAKAWINAAMSVLNNLYKVAPDELDKMNISEIASEVYEYAMLECLNSGMSSDAFVISSTVKDKTLFQKNIYFDSTESRDNGYLNAYHHINQFLNSHNSDNLVQYEIFNDRLVIFYKKDNKLQVYTDTTCSRTTLNNKVNFYLDNLLGIAPQKKIVDSVAKELYDILIRPVETALTNQTVLHLKPDGILHSLPFNSLMAANGHYLIQDHPIDYLVMTETAKRETWKSSTTGKKALLCSKSQFDLLDDLPYVSMEMKTASGTLASQHFSTTLLADSDLTRDRLQAELRNKDLIHFSTHTLVDPLNPLQSAIVISEKRGQKEKHITLQELFKDSLHFNRSPLLILSSCKSASGHLSEEGVLGFTNLFLTAGASNVIGTLWEVADKQMPAFFSVFYPGLAEQHKDIPEAVQAAQVKMIESGIAPSHWAPFVVYKK